MNLVGKFVHIDDGPGYRAGEIVGLVGDYCLIRVINLHGGPPALAISNMACQVHAVFLFDTRAELDDWLTWVRSEDNKPKPPKKRQHPHH